MAWPGSDPLAFYRSLIDSVDHDLGELLNRRAAITAAVQPHKETPERDLDREREIARALALRAPALGEDRLYRIVHQIITESLDAGGISAGVVIRPNLGLSVAPATIASARVVG